jgi:hypothetical protein
LQSSFIWMNANIPRRKQPTIRTWAIDMGRKYERVRRRRIAKRTDFAHYKTLLINYINSKIYLRKGRKQKQQLLTIIAQHVSALYSILTNQYFPCNIWTWSSFLLKGDACA